MAFISRATHTLKWPVQWVAKPQGGANPIKAGHSSDCGLQLAHMKSELLVTARQHSAVNTFPGLVHTARHVMGAGRALSQWANRKEATVQGRAGDWDEVVTR